MADKCDFHDSCISDLKESIDKIAESNQRIEKALTGGLDTDKAGIISKVEKLECVFRTVKYGIGVMFVSVVGAIVSMWVNKE